MFRPYQSSTAGTELGPQSRSPAWHRGTIRGTDIASGNPKSARTSGQRPRGRDRSTPPKPQGPGPWPSHLHRRTGDRSHRGDKTSLTGRVDSVLIQTTRSVPSSVRIDPVLKSRPRTAGLPSISSAAPPSPQPFTISAAFTRGDSGLASSAPSTAAGFPRFPCK